MQINFIINRIFVIGCLAVAMVSCNTKAPQVTNSDWPQYKKDNFRSASTNQNLDLETQGEAWVHETSQRPSPAWYGPAKEDAYAVSGPLPSMRDYDLAFYPIVVGDRLYYGSSADDAMHCLDADSGKEKWLFTTGGPIRIAPTYNNGLLYFGSDDGFVYCINASNGKLKWKYSPSPEKHQKVLNNGRLISFWPIRTGILIEDGIAYFGASLLPWKKSYVCALNIENGKADIDETYVNEYNDLTLEGAMASTGSRLIQPQGRISPVFIKKSSGEKLGQLAGTGGCFVLVTPDQNVVHGQTSRHKSLMEAPIEKQPEFMTFKDGKEMVVKGDTSYVLNETSIAAYHRETKKLLWLRRNYQAHRIVIAGDVLFAGGTDKVFAVSTKNGLTLWEGDVEGAIYALVVANNSLYASTGEGKIYCFRKGEGSSTYYAENLLKNPGIDEMPEKVSDTNEKPILQLKAGPFVQALSIDSALVKFETFEKTIVDFSWNTLGANYNIKESDRVWKHEFVLPIRKDFSYSYKIISESGEEAQFEYDNFFNYHPKENKPENFPLVNVMTVSQVSDFLNSHSLEKGFCLVMGKGAEEQGIELAAQTQLKVIKIETSKDAVDRLREKLQSNGIYGSKVAVLKVDETENLPIISEIADLVWVNDGDHFLADEVIRLISPLRYALVNDVTNKKKWLENAGLSWQVDVKDYGENSLLLIKNPIENTGDWTHQYGNSDNSSFGGESLWGSSSTEDFEIQWMGRPGPRFQTDRSGRKPSPLAVGGKLFVQGNERIIAVNVYNGTVFWAKDFPGLKRMNVLRDCSNWAADNTFLYLAINNQVLRIDQETGDVISGIKVKSEISDWSYIGILNDKLIGSESADDARFTFYHGGRGWYDAKSGPLSYKVISSRLFALSKNGVNEIWEYVPKGAVINPTITIYNNQISFVETRSANSESLETGRGGDEIYKNAWLVALDEASGKKLWEKRIRTIPGKTAYYLAAGNGKYVITSSEDGKYDIQGYDALNGQKLWGQTQKWFNSDHGAHMSKPAIVGNRLMVKPALYNIDTGEEIDYNVPKVGHGCAHYALTEQSVFYRGGSVTQFNFDNRNFSKWERLRPDCWLSTIPAEGMILSPEAGGGCSCGNWLETSMVMAPISRAPITIKSLGETSNRDYKEESYGTYIHECNFDEFVDSVKIELTVKPGVDGDLHFTIDGSEPGKDSPVYKKPFTIKKSSKVKAAIFITKGGQERKFVRNQQFTKITAANIE